jgi:hypothetical protein
VLHLSKAHSQSAKLPFTLQHSTGAFYSLPPHQHISHAFAAKTDAQLLPSQWRLNPEQTQIWDPSVGEWRLNQNSYWQETPTHPTLPHVTPPHVIHPNPSRLGAPPTKTTRCCRRSLMNSWDSFQCKPLAPDWWCILLIK